MCPYLCGGAGRAHLLALCRVADGVSWETQSRVNGRVPLLEPGGVGVEVLDGVERGAEEGARGRVGLFDQNGGQDLRVARGELVLHNAQALPVAVQARVIPVRAVSTAMSCPAGDW